MPKEKEDKPELWILEDLSRQPLRGSIKNEDVAEKLARANAPWLGHAVVAGPFEAHVALDFTGSPGAVSGVYYSLCFQLRKWEYMVQKADEWIEVSPVHAQYYQLTQKQKEELEGRIKQGLVSVSQSIADMELLLHDRRRYHEFLHYMGYRTSKELMKDKKNEKEEEAHNHPDEEEICFAGDTEARADNHSLKAVFIDQVDMHTGDGISMRSIVSRWPTLITDFMRMGDDDMEPDKVMDKLQVSKAEAVVLVTKNRLYQEWKTLFGPEIKSRYMRISELVRSRLHSVEQYKEWLKPFIARHRLIEEGMAKPEGRKKPTTSFITSGGAATSSAKIVLYVWKDFIVPELYKGGSEDYAKLIASKKLEVDDSWTRKNLIFSKRYGLINKYKWITEKWVEEQKEEMRKAGWLTPHKPYYSFFIITLDKTTIRMPTGDELENGVFDVNMFLMSQNAAFCKMLELKAREEEMEQYVDKMLGMHKPPRAVARHEEKGKNIISKALDKFSMAFEFAKPGPYERDFNDRIAKVMLARCAQERYGPIVDFIRQKMGMGWAK